MSKEPKLNCMAINRLQDGGFVVTRVNEENSGSRNHHLLAATTIDEVFAYVRSQMTTESTPLDTHNKGERAAWVR